METVAIGAGVILALTASAKNITEIIKIIREMRDTEE